MSDLSWKTKKEIIIENVYRDPFLTVSDLAELADTTSRYVRTILSAENLSLLKLRKEYARKIENRDISKGDNLLLSYIYDTPFSTVVKFLHNKRIIINNTGDINEILPDADKNYKAFSYQHLRSDHPWCISTVFIKNDLYTDSSEDELAYSKLMEYFHRLLNKSRVELSAVDFFIDLSNGQIAAYLDLSSLAPILCARQYLSVDSSIVVYQLAYFSGGQVGISISKSGKISIKRKNAAV